MDQPPQLGIIGNNTGTCPSRRKRSQLGAEPRRPPRAESSSTSETMAGRRPRRRPVRCAARCADIVRAPTGRRSPGCHRPGPRECGTGMTGTPPIERGLGGSSECRLGVARRCTPASGRPGLRRIGFLRSRSPSTRALQMSQTQGLIFACQWLARTGEGAERVGGDVQRPDVPVTRSSRRRTASLKRSSPPPSAPSAIAYSQRGSS